MADCSGESSRLNGKKRVLSLFSGCGGMDIGFEGGFSCLARSINENIHPDWIEERRGYKVLLKRTAFEAVFANDIRAQAKSAWESYFRDRGDTGSVYHLESVVDLVTDPPPGKPGGF